MPHTEPLLRSKSSPRRSGCQERFNNIRLGTVVSTAPLLKSTDYQRQRRGLYSRTVKWYAWHWIAWLWSAPYVESVVKSWEQIGRGLAQDMRWTKLPLKLPNLAVRERNSASVHSDLVFSCFKLFNQLESHYLQEVTGGLQQKTEKKQKWGN